MKKIKTKFFKILIVLPIICSIVLFSSLSVFAATGWTDANETAFNHAKLKQFNLYYIGNQANGSLIGQDYTFQFEEGYNDGVGYNLFCSDKDGRFDAGYYCFKFYFDITNYNNNFAQEFNFDFYVDDWLTNGLTAYDNSRTYLQIYSSNYDVITGTYKKLSSKPGFRYSSTILPEGFEYGFNETGYGNVQCSFSFYLPSNVYAEYLVFGLNNFEYKNIRPSASNPQSNNPTLNDYGATEDVLLEETQGGFDVTADIDNNVVKATQSNIFSKGMVVIGKIFENGLSKIPFLQTLFDYSMSFGFFAFLLGMTSLVIGVVRTTKRNNNDKGGG